VIDMCGRYTIFSDTEQRDIRDIIDEVQRKVNGELKTGEIFPTDKAPVLIEQQNKITPELFTWGFPNFKSKGVIINARSETLMERPMFRGCLSSKRCVIPSTGFYEWTHTGEKEKYLFNLPDTQALYMAGLYNDFDGERRFVILTMDADSSMADIHNRMPLVLRNDEVNHWIRNQSEAFEILDRKRPLLEKRLA